MAKIVEKLACRQLVAFFERLKLLPSLQSAYRKKHSTETAVLKVITDVLRGVRVIMLKTTKDKTKDKTKDS